VNLWIAATSSGGEDTLEITDSMLTDHNEHSTTMVAVQGIKLQSFMKLIEHKKFKASDTLWCDVRIDKYD
jgi:hypothetical protein